MQRDEMKQILERGIADFTYIKSDGSRRQALGTLHPSRLPPMPTDPEAAEKIRAKAAASEAANPDVLTYWDTEANGWRKVNLGVIVELPVLIETL